MKNNKNCVKVVGGIIFLCTCLTFWILNYETPLNEEKKTMSRLYMNSIHKLPRKLVESNYQSNKGDQPDFNCKMYNCFDVYKCGNTASNHITVYLYPLTDFVDTFSKLITPKISKEFYEIYASIASSRYYVSSSKEACLFIPPIDLLNEERLDIDKVSHVLASLPHWNHGKNNLLFNMLPGKAPDYSTTLDVAFGKSIIAGGGFSHWTYRSEFDVSIPVYSSIAHNTELDKNIKYRRWLLSSVQSDLHSDLWQELEKLDSSNSDFLLLQSCCTLSQDSSVSISTTRCKGNDILPYPKILKDSKFCLILPTARLGQAILSDALKAGCIPVIACDTYVLPFSEVLDWKRAAIVIRESNLHNVMTILKGVSLFQIEQMQKQGKYFYQKYFSSIHVITQTTLQIINDRIFPDSAWSYDQWNTPPDIVSVNSPLLLSHLSPVDDGFTAVILAYDRVESLFQLMIAIDKVPSLKSILVIWNNQQKSFPLKKEWPIIDHEWKVIQTTANKLSNRFYPYSEIKTEAVLAIDDDIVMLTADEVEFAYQVWREFPDQIVGFPPRLHLLMDNAKLKYESEWKNNISIVLTGAAFYHNYFNHLYTYKMPGDIRDWVDEHMNCEDIAMNFVASNHTGKAPIKVTPRKKFKCSTCATSGSLSLDESHMVERSTCINYFVKQFGMLPLKTVNFRADPVLFKDDFPEKLKMFPNLGML